MKILHVVGGSPQNGAYQGARILHETLLEMKIDSSILNDSNIKSKNFEINDHSKSTYFVNDSFYKNILSTIFVTTEKILKTIFLHSPRSTFTIGLLGFDITKLNEYKNADIIHLHWLNQGFINLTSLSKINKPVIWTLRDMWAFTGGSHYNIDFEKYEKSFFSKKFKIFKKKCYNDNFQFVAISDWLKKEAKNSLVLKDRDVSKIDNNIDLSKFTFIPKNEAKNKLNIFTQKKIILFGANNPQIKRKGWDIFIDTLKKLDKSKYYLSIFGNFWSNKILDEIGIEYKNFGFIKDKKKLNYLYSSSDIFVASSIQEAFGKTWAESLACGTPFVCFANTAAAGIIKHKIDGYIVNELNSNQLKDGIDWLIENLNKIKDKNDLRKIAEKFDTKKIAEEYIQLYKGLIS